jgi:hypothetical protein
LWVHLGEDSSYSNGLPGSDYQGAPTWTVFNTETPTSGDCTLYDESSGSTGWWYCNPTDLAPGESVALNATVWAARAAPVFLGGFWAGSAETGYWSYDQQSQQVDGLQIDLAPSTTFARAGDPLQVTGTITNTTSTAAGDATTFTNIVSNGAITAGTMSAGSIYTLNCSFPEGQTMVCPPFNLAPGRSTSIRPDSVVPTLGSRSTSLQISSRSRVSPSKALSISTARCSP